ncbi:MAG: branched-chain amino acid ABC transporter permease [Devosiaceae bacterium]|nr:branched-chain amino acid ABC transporter permease [Devosiaceae bacterium]
MQETQIKPAENLAQTAAPARSRKFLIKLLIDLALIGVGIAAYFIFPDNLGFITRILIMIILVLSLDLVLGYAGVATLGHAALFGAGAYGAGLFAVYFSADPLLGLLVGAIVGAIIAFISGLFLMRAHGLTLLMLTIAVAQILQEIINKERAITGGSDGLLGIDMDPIFGIYAFDFFGKTGYLYALTVLVIVFFALKILVASPFGAMAKGIHESAPRMRAIGTPVYWRLVGIYTISGFIAGIAGAVSAQVTELVSLEAFGFALSAEAMVMLILGGLGRLYGAIIGTVIFMVVHHTAASIDPFNWLFVIGTMVLIVVYFVPEGFMGLPVKLRRWLRWQK